MNKEFVMPELPKEEAPGYTGVRRNYPDKELWFESRAFQGAISPYVIVSKNGDSRFNIDEFINSKQGELALSRIKHELCLVGNYQWGCNEMIDYWAKRGIVETVYNDEDKKNEFVTFVPDYIVNDEEEKKYPLIIDYHGGGGTIFEAINHGFVDICYENKFMVVCPEVDGTRTKYASEHLDELIDDLINKDYPVDITRIYLAGHSMGGIASIYGSLTHSKKIAAIAPHGCSGVFDENMQFEKLTDEMYAISKTIPMFLEIGTCDFHQLPLIPSSINGLNKWLIMNGCNSSDSSDNNSVGITGDKVYVKEIDETEFTFVDFFDKNNIHMVQIVGVKGLPHWVGYSYSKLAWAFLSQFSRDLEGNLVIQ